MYKFFFFVLIVQLSGCGGTRFATIKDPQGDDVMLIGHDPVAYFTIGKPLRGDPKLRATHDGAAYYFALAEHRELFLREPQRYIPQYGGFCANGAPYGIKLGSDPTEFAIYQGRLFIFGDIVGHSYWTLDRAFNVQQADSLWPSIKETGWRSATLIGWTQRVAWYRDTASLEAQWQKVHPNKKITYDPGGLFTNLVIKYPGWRAREGFGQPALGFPEIDPCPPACPGVISQASDPGWRP